MKFHGMKKTLWVPLLLLLLGTGFMYAAGTPGEGGTVDLTAFCSSQKGFNLLGKFDVSWSNTGYTEKEFYKASNSVQPNPAGSVSLFR
jgi:hypothetical protein